MRISSFNINKFCGAYNCQSRYYNPKNIDFKTSIKEIMDSLLKNKDDIIFVQEFINNKYIDIGKLFPDEKYAIFYNGKKLLESNVVAITLKNSLWEQIEEAGKMELSNKIIEMRLKIYDLNIVSFHNTDKLIEEKINNYLEKEEKQIILGDFNDCEWIDELHHEKKGYRDLVTNDMITYKPAQTAIDRVFIKKKEYDKKIVFNGIIETFSSDHNVVTFTLNL